MSLRQILHSSVMMENLGMTEFLEIPAQMALRAKRAAMQKSI
jgi:hypothetical protein